MGERTEGETTNRRDFLKLASVSVPAAAIAAAAGTAEAAAPKDDGEGMRDTAHTRAYYESARF
ncbi:MAG: twin-arginine translocation pathway signal protein [Alphaproteobacteria bacterium]|nr:twin-arginine translocation pathway signal protein [Alphaproteobacteria bacterium]